MTKINSTSSLSTIDISKIDYKEDITYKEFRKIVLSGKFTCLYGGRKTIFRRNTLTNAYRSIDTINESQVSNDNDVEKNNNDCNNNNDTYDNIDTIVLSNNDYDQLLITLFDKFIKDFCLNTRKNFKSVKRINFKKVRIVCHILLLAILFCLFIPYIGKILSIIFIIYYTICIFVKCIIFAQGIHAYDSNVDNNNNTYNKNSILPRYTILIPMFKENRETIQQSINAINNLIYPKELLDVKFVLEDDDKQTQDILNNITLPDYMTKILVPYFEPRTKPKACNVASLFATGDIITIFDAEDIPDKMQLLKVVEEFKNKDNKTSTNDNNNTDILQCNLCFYNYNQNLLTKCFNIEYIIWFKLMIAPLSKMNISIPLGGTSNHIKFPCLERSNFLDSYNVTEDLELSTIATVSGTNIQHVNSDTKEWCVINIKSWLKQRTRWLKGYLLTYMLLFFDKKLNSNIKNIIFLHVIIGYTVLCFLCNFYLMISLMIIKITPILILFYTICTLRYINYIVLYFKLKNNKNKTWQITVFQFIVYPLYFVLHIIASWMALTEILHKPFYWSKTNHLTNRAKTRNNSQDHRKK